MLKTHTQIYFNIMSKNYRKVKDDERLVLQVKALADDTHHEETYYYNSGNYECVVNPFNASRYHPDIAKDGDQDFNCIKDSFNPVFIVSYITFKDAIADYNNNTQ